MLGPTSSTVLEFQRAERQYGPGHHRPEFGCQFSSEHDADSPYRQPCKVDQSDDVLCARWVTLPRPFDPARRLTARSDLKVLCNTAHTDCTHCKWSYYHVHSRGSRFALMLMTVYNQNHRYEHLALRTVGNTRTDAADAT